MKFSLQILGSSGALPAYNRFPTAQVLNHNDRLFLIDCGEATQMRFQQFGVKRGKINHIFISHLHGDHYFGLLGLLTSYMLLQRAAPLYLYGPPQLMDILNVHLPPSEHYPFKLHFIPTQNQKAECIYEDAELMVSSIPLKHRIPTTGFVFREKLGERKMRKDKIAEYNIHFSHIPSIKKGDSYTTPNGTIIPNQELTDDPPPPRSFAFCSDTAYHEPVLEHIANVDLLYHESTFGNDQKDDAAKKSHSTAEQAATIALKANAKQLVLGHYSAKYPDLSPLLKEAQAVFPNTHLGLEGKVFDIL